MAAEEVNVIALVENLELAVPRRLPVRLLQEHQRPAQQPRVIELGDRDSKLALKRQLNLDLDDKIADKSSRASESEERESLEILRRLPPGTVLIKQIEAKELRDEQMEKRPAKEENESEKPKKPPQRIRSKKALEVRRNPLRSASVRKGGCSRDGRALSSRQRLLAAKRGRSLGDDLGSRRCSGPATPAGHMSTRSTTRKRGNVGATLEAPTWRDEAEWKDWPVHGMHERPVYHPQFGLAAEYNGRLFASFDGEGYREIGAGAAPIEVVRVDPRAESLDHREPRPSSAGLEVKRFAIKHVPPASQKLPAQTPAGDKTRLTGLQAAYTGRTFERLHALTQSLGLTHQHQPPQHQHHQHQQKQPPHLDQIRGLERLQQLESLQRLSSRIRLQSGEGCSKYAPAGRLVSKETLRSLQQSANLPSQPSPSKCLILSRGPGSAPVTLPFCGVQAVKGNPKGKLFFVRASDAPRKPEKPATVTSGAAASVSWAEVSLRKRRDGSSALLVDVPRTYAAGQTSQPRTPRGYPPSRLAQASSIFRPKVEAPREDPGLTASKCNAGDYGFRIGPTDDQLTEVLDLSKKEARKTEERMQIETPRGDDEAKVSQSCPTDLVHYFQNFGADESIDLFEDSKNLT